uniref:Cystatin domain-containing protein n=1 Tax=Sciurus vulgaris TaxID=55149 RepID=A0A8D2CW83_SCIVU
MVIPLRIPLLLLAALVAGCAARPELGRSSQLMLGGLEEADIHEEGVHQAIDYAISVYNQENNDIYYSRVRRVVRARKQVVTGTNYYLDLEIGRTSCSKSQSDLSECPFIEHPHEHKRTFCSFQVYIVPWLHTISMTQYSCHND